MNLAVRTLMILALSAGSSLAAEQELGLTLGALSGPDFLNFGPDGKLYVSDNNKRVYSFTITG